MKSFLVSILMRHSPVTQVILQDFARNVNLLIQSPQNIAPSNNQTHMQ